MAFRLLMQAAASSQQAHGDARIQSQPAETHMAEEPRDVQGDQPMSAIDFTSATLENENAAKLRVVPTCQHEPPAWLGQAVQWMSWLGREVGRQEGEAWHCWVQWAVGAALRWLLDGFSLSPIHLVGSFPQPSTVKKQVSHPPPPSRFFNGDDEQHLGRRTHRGRNPRCAAEWDRAGFEVERVGEN